MLVQIGENTADHGALYSAFSFGRGTAVGLCQLAISSARTDSTAFSKSSTQTEPVRSEAYRGILYTDIKYNVQVHACAVENMR